ncbi:hypothetical protein [Arthrobacter sp. ISL-30]|uniref:hypothetical protein n=1 Tax=Arthrobacter sp. ISL-30 TaxID=2819109 RepID=UPI001BE65EAE|nr:hypothetical protein [Arthrobacter sp. ISL-30]MBT2515591.1 hypothetical protein [Arthrobacter sp. ISL-30]
MNWTDKVPPWLPPVGEPMRPPRTGRVLITMGLVILIGFFAFAIVMGALGASYTLYALLPLVIGLTLLITGLLRRNNAFGPRDEL